MEPDLYETWRPRLLRFCTHLLRHSHDAEEVVQDVFAKLLAKPGVYALEVDAGVLLFRLARNRCIDVRRKKAPESRDDLVVLARDERRGAELSEALGFLSFEEREVLLLTTIEELGYREVAVILRCSLGTVAARKYSAIQELARRLAP